MTHSAVTSTRQIVKDIHDHFFNLIFYREN